MTHRIMNMTDQRDHFVITSDGDTDPTKPWSRVLLQIWRPRLEVSR